MQMNVNSLYTAVSYIDQYCTLKSRTVTLNINEKIIEKVKWVIFLKPHCTAKKKLKLHAPFIEMLNHEVLTIS